VSNVLATKFASGLFDDNLFVNLTLLNSTLDAPPHRALAYDAAAESLILLQVCGLFSGGGGGGAGLG
jgi:beta-glucosidase-like glycosyl hydrolase